MRVGDREVLSSGTIVTHYGDDNVEIGHADLRFKLIFERGEGGPAQVKGDGGGKFLTLRLINFDNLFGTAWFGEVGTAHDKKLFLAIFVHTLGEGDKLNRLINFTFSAG
jgi:hypothetical protein